MASEPKLTPMIFNTGLTLLGSKASILHHHFVINQLRNLDRRNYLIKLERMTKTISRRQKFSFIYQTMVVNFNAMNSTIKLQDFFMLNDF